MKGDTAKAIFNMGGPTMVSRRLGVSKSTVGKWIRNNHIPNLEKAEQVAKASGFSLDTLRPQYKQ